MLLPPGGHQSDLPHTAGNRETRGGQITAVTEYGRHRFTVYKPGGAQVSRFYIQGVLNDNRLSSYAKQGNNALSIIHLFVCQCTPA